MSRPITHRLLVALLVTGLISCSQPDMTETAQTRFTALESRLLQSENVALEYHVESTGAFLANLNGTLRLHDDHSVTLTAEGLFGNATVQLSLQADQQSMQGGNGAAGFDIDTPANLRPALLIGLTRMGILHNLARLTAAQPPDQADGDVQTWVRATDLSASGDALSFAIVVAGQPSGNATLMLDARGLPAYREQVVNFPGGSMQVTERYQWLD